MLRPLQLFLICSTFTNNIQVMKGEKLGEFEEMILLTVYLLGEGAYGVTIQRGMEKETHRSASVGAVYAALDRLQRKRYVKSRMGGATQIRGGRRKRLFLITPRGIAALQQVRQAREKMWSAIHSLYPSRA